MSWSKRLAAPIKLKDGRMLRSLDDACVLLIGLNERSQSAMWCQHAAELLLKAADSGEPGDIEAATIQMRRALSREGMI
jgi:HEPN domain-containing protein